MSFFSRLIPSLLLSTACWKYSMTDDEGLNTQIDKSYWNNCECKIGSANYPMNLDRSTYDSSSHQLPRSHTKVKDSPQNSWYPSNPAPRNSRWYTSCPQYQYYCTIHVCSCYHSSNLTLYPRIRWWYFVRFRFFLEGSWTSLRIPIEMIAQSGVSWLYWYTLLLNKEYWGSGISHSWARHIR